MKTADGWQEVHDVHTSNDNKYDAHVIGLDTNQIHFEKYNKNGIGAGTNNTMTHQEFRDNHTPKTIFNPSRNGVESGADHVLNYFKNPIDTATKTPIVTKDTTIKVESKKQKAPIATVTADDISSKGETLIRNFEGLKLKAYKDKVGNWTIGYGSTYLADGTHVKKGDVLETKEEAEKLFKDTLKGYVKTVKNRAKVPLTHNQLDSLTSFIYNAGKSAGKTVFEKLNNKDYDGAADALLVWDKVTDPDTKKKIVSKDLKERRIKERALFLKPDDK